MAQLARASPRPYYRFWVRYKITLAKGLHHLSPSRKMAEMTCAPVKQRKGKMSFRVFGDPFARGMEKRTSQNNRLLDAARSGAGARIASTRLIAGWAKGMANSPQRNSNMNRCAQRRRAHCWTEAPQMKPQ